jgi:hypothetical protein
MNVMHLETRVIAKSILFAVLNWRRQWSHITQLKLPPNPKLFEASSFRSPFDEYLDLLHRIHHTLLEMCINLLWWCLISTCWISKKKLLISSRSKFPRKFPHTRLAAGRLQPFSRRRGQRRRPRRSAADAGGWGGSLPTPSSWGAKPKEKWRFHGRFQWGLPWTWTHMNSWITHERSVKSG